MTMRLFGAFVALLALCAEASCQESAAPLSNWNSALASFREVGAAIEKDDLDGAKELLEQAAATLPSPYREKALETRQELIDLTHPDPSDPFSTTIDDREILGGYYYYVALGDICNKSLPARS